MAPVSLDMSPLDLAVPSSPSWGPWKATCRAGGEGGPLGVGRCSTSLYKDALVNPKAVPGGDGRSTTLSPDSFVDRSVSCLLEHCLGWEPAEGPPPEELAGPLLPACRGPLLSLPALHTCIAEGCDPNLASSRGRAALHLLLAPQHAPAAPRLLPAAAALLLRAGAALDQRDAEGATPLLSLHRLLELRQFALAAELASLLLSSSADCDVNSVNSAGRSLLSYSVTYLDSAAELTRVLVNHGARVWPGPDPAPSAPTVEEIRRDREQSAFTWFLRAVVRQRGLGGSDSTVTCLSHEMGRQPRRMKAHVLRTMVAEGRYPRVLGPVFLQLKLAMEPFWSEPQDLRYLAWTSVRRSLGPRRLDRASRQLGLPGPLTRYITLARRSRPHFSTHSDPEHGNHLPEAPPM